MVAIESSTMIVDASLQNIVLFMQSMHEATYTHTHYGQPSIEHVTHVHHILKSLGMDSSGLTAALLFLVPQTYLKPEKNHKNQVHQQYFNLIEAEQRLLIEYTHKLTHTAWQFEQAQSKDCKETKEHLEKDSKEKTNAASKTEAFRKMVLACAQDTRAVIILLASILETLRWYSKEKKEVPAVFADYALHVYAPLANRLGIWQIKWELEDLAFRFLQPQTYRQIASLLDEKRIERQQFIEQMRQTLLNAMQEHSIKAEVSGRPKHIYSIWKKMHGKNLSFSHLYDVRAFRITVDSIKDCYSALGLVHALWGFIPKEFDDYISQPKPNGYQSLHTVVIADDGKAVEIQIRTQAMHQAAEFGLSAHWLYKESGTKGYKGEQVNKGLYEEKITLLRQLLEWKDDANQERWEKAGNWQDDHIYVFTPQGEVIALPIGATVLDFAYMLHTNLGHRCRGAKVNGKMVPLTTVLENTQTIEIISVKEGGPSRDWLINPAYLISNRAKSKIRAWFNALDMQEKLQKGRHLLDKVLQREGKTNLNLEQLALALQFKALNQLLLALAKEEFTTKEIEQYLQLQEKLLKEAGKDTKDSKDLKEHDSQIALDGLHIKATSKTGKLNKAKQQASLKDVLVAGSDKIGHQMAKCCKPIPGDAIKGFITKQHAISVHRQNCSMIAKLAKLAPERLIDVDWAQTVHVAHYVFDVVVHAEPENQFMHALNEVIAKHKTQITAFQSRPKQNYMHIVLTLQTEQSMNIAVLLTKISAIDGVIHAYRP